MKSVPYRTAVIRMLKLAVSLLPPRNYKALATISPTPGQSPPPSDCEFPEIYYMRVNLGI